MQNVNQNKTEMGLQKTNLEWKRGASKNEPKMDDYKTTRQARQVRQQFPHTTYTENLSVEQ